MLRTNNTSVNTRLFMYWFGPNMKYGQIDDTHKLTADQCVNWAQFQWNLQHCFATFCNRFSTSWHTQSHAVLFSLVSMIIRFAFIPSFATIYSSYFTNQKGTTSMRFMITTHYSLNDLYYFGPSCDFSIIARECSTFRAPQRWRGAVSSCC